MKLYNGLTHTPATLPRAFYTDAAHHQAELRDIWYKNWLYLCRAETLDGALSFRTFEVGDQPILLLRDGNLALRAYYNVCRHRGAILCTEPSGRLNTRLLTCPYHNWSFGLDGRLVATSSKQTAPDFNKADYPLHGIAVTEWRGFVFVNLAGASAPPFEPVFDLDSTNLNNWPLESLRAAHAATKILDCNWKIFWENFSECLHCPNAHPELCDLVPIYKRAFQDERDDPHWQDHAESRDPKYKGGLKAGALTWSMDGQPHSEVFAELTDAERAAGQNFVVKLPALMMVGHIDYVRIVRMRPLGPTRTELYVEWLFPPAAIAAAGFSAAPVVDFTNLVMAQDVALCALNQRGLAAAPFESGVLMPEEYVLHEFHDWIRNQRSQQEA
jgi:Rieske 2Fe-2S family protein